MKLIFIGSLFFCCLAQGQGVPSKIGDLPQAPYSSGPVSTPAVPAPTVNPSDPNLKLGNIGAGYEGKGTANRSSGARNISKAKKEAQDIVRATSTSHGPAAP